ncbi:type II toxin-antitoxin system RelE/ParE family toxin [Lacticaseibacillus rhamnosus]|uniref:type II toxin-antitoxin system RelE/ParE family toxin n=1 Tax=Lacticaseibacillus rhamnosus TaxID=47715 RepID=UPI002469AD7C|nr:type II toxin-antitoxin system RelE/ParE family toxin [Lacticaseibacillus rhamnosus]MDH5104209.1 type II toxin-antitoxin system RelE/ParE family toxin [Lacticaseibacillus rhamnosus]
MIKSFADKETEKVFHQKFSQKLPQTIQKSTLRKLLMIDNAENINDLRIPPSNRLEQLSGRWRGRYSIRINNQFRICFQVENINEFLNVEIIDYH